MEVIRVQVTGGREYRVLGVKQEAPARMSGERAKNVPAERPKTRTLFG